MVRPLPLRALQVFEAVGHYGSISRAAEHLGISVGAVSQQMRILEEALGTRLASRDGRRLQLSALGERLHKRCTAGFEELRGAVEDVERNKKLNGIRVSALPSMMAKWVSPLSRKWAESYPDLELYLDSSLIDNVDVDGADFRITYGPPRAGEANHVRLFQDRVVPVCSPRVMARAASSPLQLLDFKLVSIRSDPTFDSPPSWPEWFESAGMNLTTSLPQPLSFSSSSLAVEAAIDGAGVVLAQMSLVNSDLDAGRLVVAHRHGVSLRSPYYLSWHRSALDRSQCREFHRWIVSCGRRQQKAIDSTLGSLGTDVRNQSHM